jgi:hypothetical protein
LSEKFKALKAEHQILLQESLECKKFVADATQMTTTIQQHGISVAFQLVVHPLVCCVYIFLHFLELATLIS